jgi:hypothetical protein
MYVLLKKIKITPFRELFWKIKIQQQKKMLSMHTKIPRVKKLGHLLPVLPLTPQKTTKMRILHDSGCAATLINQSLVKTLKNTKEKEQSGLQKLVILVPAGNMR